MESVVYKFHKANKHSSIFYGPYTLVYGLGALFILMINKYVYPIEINSYLKLLIIYITLTAGLTTIEYLDGNLLKTVFKIDMWDYSNHKYHFGKYICLGLALTWGLLGTIINYFIIPFTDKISNLINTNGTLAMIIILLADLIITIKNKTY